jgi:hypothetical protein
VLDLLDPAVREQVDEPVLAAWMAAVKQHLGAFRGLSGSKFSTSSKVEGGHTILESGGEVEFEKGTAESQLRFVDDLIVAFKIESEVLPKPWFTELPDTSLYDRRAREFLAKLLAADADGALAMMHEDLRAKFERDQLRSGLEGLKTRLGEVAQVQSLTQEFRPGPPQEVVLRYTLDGARQDVTAYVRFAFDGMKGHLLGFTVPE